MQAVRTFILSMTFCATLTGLLISPRLIYAGTQVSKEGFSQEEVERDPEGQIAILSKKLSEGVTPSRLQELIDNEILTGLIGWKDNIQRIKLNHGFVSKNYVTDSTLELLSRNFPNLAEIGLGHCSSLSNDGLQHLSALENLVKLNLEQCWVHELGKSVDISALQGLTNLTWLSLERCRRIRDISALRSLINLTWLNLSECHIEDISALQSLTNLTYLNLEGCIHIKNFSPIMHLPKLTHLVISQCWWSAAGWLGCPEETLRNIAKTLPSLQKIGYIDDSTKEAPTDRHFQGNGLKKFIEGSNESCTLQ